MLQISDIKEGAKFKCDTGIVWIIDKVNSDYVETSMEGGSKGNYRDTIQTVVEFLNEEKAEKV